MYFEYFDLSRDPFSISPDPDFLFLSPSHKEAIGSLLFCIENRLGVGVVTGEVGTGKTTILRYYLAHCNRQNIVPIYIFNPNISYQELLRTILEELDENITFHRESDLFRVMQRALLRHAEAGRTVILLIDEAQNTPVKTLEQLRLLSNFETTRAKLLQIILIGQPELDNLLGNYSLRQLRQRVAVRAVITPLTRRETRAYIEHRVAAAGGEASRLFSKQAMQRIVDYSGGAPRTVNILCSNALITTIGYGRRQVDKNTVNEVAQDLVLTAGTTFSRFRFALATIIMVLLGIASAYGLHHTLFLPGSATIHKEATPSSPASQHQKRQFITPAASPGLAGKASFHAEDKAGGIVRTPAPPPSRNAANPISATSLQRHTALPQVPPTTSERSPKSFRKFISRKVQRGDYLTKMSMEIYGEATKTTLSRLQKANPQIRDPNLIFEGDTLRFPR